MKTAALTTLFMWADPDIGRQTSKKRKRELGRDVSHSQSGDIIIYTYYTHTLLAHL